jgi:hypothetical protein
MSISGFPPSKQTGRKKRSYFSTSPACPACGTKNIRRTGRLGWAEKLISLFGFYPFRCSNYRCNHRFVKVGKF